MADSIRANSNRHVRYPFLFGDPFVKLIADFHDFQTEGKQAVMFMDYKANEDIVPYILDEFSYMWETPPFPVPLRGLEISPKTLPKGNDIWLTITLTLNSLSPANR